MFGKPYMQLEESEKFEVNQAMQQDIASNRLKNVM
jgi:hypothetical protein